MKPLSRRALFLLVLVTLAGHVGSSPSVGRRVRAIRAPGDHPEGLCWDGASLWCNNFTNGTLYKLDPRDGRILRQFSGGGLPVNPEGLAWDGQHVWTCDWQTGNILKLQETPSGIEILSVHPKPEGSGQPVGLEWDGRSLWLATWASARWERGQLYELDPVTLETLHYFPLPVYNVEDLAWDGYYLWSCDWLFGIGFAIDTATGDTLHTYRSPGRLPNPVGQAWDGEHLWVGDTGSDSLFALDISGARPTPVERRSWSDMKRMFGR